MATEGGPAGDRTARLRELRARTAALRTEIAAYHEAVRVYRASGGTAEDRLRSREVLQIKRLRLRADFDRLQYDWAALPW